MTLTVCSERQYEVQNDRPCCGYSHTFWSLVTSTVCAASFTLAQWSTVKSSSMTLALSLASNQAATVEQHWAYFAGIWQTSPLWYPCLGPVIPFPVPFTWVWNVGCFWQRTLSRRKLRWTMLALCAGTTHVGVWGMNSRGLRPTVNINFLAWLTEAIYSFCCASTLQTLHVQWVECEVGGVLGDGNEGVRDTSGPCIPYCLFANSKHRQPYITSCEWMEEEKCLAAMQ